MKFDTAANAIGVAPLHAMPEGEALAVYLLSLDQVFWVSLNLKAADRTKRVLAWEQDGRCPELLEKSREIAPGLLVCSIKDVQAYCKPVDVDWAR